MEPLRVLTSHAAVLDRVNVDTDQIIPKQFLKRVERDGFGQFLFFNWRFLPDGTANPDFELNDKRYHGAQILVAGHNFGCGSSREHAPWALKDYGYKVIVSSGFADIFYNNCMKNGILPIVLRPELVKEMMMRSEAEAVWTVDLPGETIWEENRHFADFTIDRYWKEMLQNGWDEIDLTLKYEKQIANFEKNMQNVGG